MQNIIVIIISIFLIINVTSCKSNKDKVSILKEENLELIITRMQGWQLETFKESYNYKKNEGVSLFKKNLLKNK